MSVETIAFINGFARKAARYYNKNVKNDEDLCSFLEFLYRQFDFDFMKDCKLGLGETNVIGEFDHETWSIAINFSKFPSDNLLDKASELVNTIYHETRHAEQYFRVARLLASQGKNEDEIFIELGTPS